MSRDVELVVRAKDAATKAIDSIKDALSELTDVQKDVGQSAQKTDSLLGDLGRQLSQLNNEAKGLAALGKVATEIDRAGAAVGRLEGDVRKSANEFGRLARETQEASANTARLRGEIEAERRLIEQNTASRREASKELTQANQAVKQAERNQTRLNAALAKTPETKQSRAMQSANVFVAGDLEGARAKQAALSESVAAYAANIDKSKAALKGFEPQVAAAAAQERKLSNETEKTANALGRQRNDLSNARTEFAGITQAANTASKSFTGTAFNADQVTAASAKMAAELARTKARIEGLNQATKAQPKIVASTDTGDVERQRRTLLELRREWANSQGEVKRLAQEMRAVKQPTEEMAAAFGRAQAAARIAKDQYQAQQVALRALAGSSQGSFSAFEQSAKRLRTSSEIQADALQQMSAAGRGVVQALPPIAAAARSTGDGMAQAATGGKRLRESLGLVSEGSRQSLSLFQRLRGEVLSLAAAYLGLYGAANQIGKILDSYQTLESAQAKLGVVFKGDTGKVGKELQFLEVQAQRLGVSFSVLGDQYAKFAVAANAANYSSEATRKIFLSVAEAGRVNRLSTDQLNGVFLALTQMISKGKVSAEELRGQLGERMSGAFNIFADAIGVTTEQLDEMLKKGEVVARQGTLLKFANELNARFGPELAKALKGTSAEIGRFQDNLFQAQIRIGEGGFIESFTEGLRSLNEYFRSREGRDFFLSIGAALGNVASIAAEVPKYFNEIGLAIKLIIGYKLGTYFTGIITSIRESQGSVTGFVKSFYDFNGVTATASARAAAFAESGRAMSGVVGAVRTNLIGATTGLALFAGNSRAVSAGMTALRTVMVGVAGTARMLWAALGGLPGIILTGVTLAIGAWATKVDDTVSAVDEHKRIMGEVVTAYQLAKGEAEGLAKAVRNVSLDQANANVRAMRDELEKTKATVADFKFTGFFSASALKADAPDQFAIAEQLRDLKKSFLDGQTSAKDFVTQLEKLYAAATDDDLRMATELLLGYARSASDAEQRVGEAAVTAKTLGSNLQGLDEDANRAGASIEKLAVNTDTAGQSIKDAAKEGAAEFSAKLAEINKLLPKMSDELQRLGKLDAINKLYLDAAKLATSMSQVVALTQQAQQATDMVLGESSNYGDLADRIIGVESGGNANAKNPSSSATGLGQFIESTWLKMFKEYFPDRAANLTDAMILALRNDATISKNMVQLYLKENSAILQKAGVAVTDANLYLAHFLGPGGAVAVAKASAQTRVADILAPSQVNANKSILGGGQTVAGLQAWAQKKVGGGSTEQAAINKELTQNEAKRTEKAKEYNTELANRLSLQEQENANGGKLTQEAFVQKQLAEEMKRAREAEVTLSDEQIARIKAQAAEEWNITNAKREGKTAQQEANAASQAAAALAAQRNELQKQFNAAQATGDSTATDALQTRLGEVNTQLADAIAKAREMWLAIGGPEAETALVKLDTLQLKAKRSEDRLGALGLTVKEWRSAADSFAGGVADSFGSFVEAIANGKNAVQAFGQTFLQMSAQVLQELAKIAIKKAVLNIIGSFTGSPVAMGHTGGLVGAGGVGLGNMRKSVSPALFAHAMRFHTGGIPGLRPDEVPIIAKKSEEIITDQDPRHRMNGGLNGDSGSTVAPSFRHVLVMDEESANNHLKSASGEKVIISHIRKNASTIKRMLG